MQLNTERVAGAVESAAGEMGNLGTLGSRFLGKWVPGPSGVGAPGGPLCLVVLILV